MAEVGTFTDEHRFPCTTCGADMRFDPPTGTLKCDHCGAEAAVSNAPVPPVREQDYDRALQDGLAASGDLVLGSAPTVEIRVSQCPNCGAQVEFSETTHAAECPYCATPVVTDTGAHRQIKPQGLLPFALDESAAHTAMTDWLGRLWFAPNGLKEYARKGRRMSGVYVPYWTYDADTKSSYRGERGDHYYVSRTVMRDGKPTVVQERRTRWSSRSGRVARFFDDILVLASHALPRKYTEALAPWDLSDMEPYRPDFLAGFRSEAYTVRVDEGYTEARDYMDRMILRDVRFDIGGDEQRVHDVQTTVRDVTFKHILLPVWVAAYKYRGKTYRFVVNGRSGRVRGERPYSAWKIAFAVVLGLAVAAIVGYLVAMNQQGG